jgi:hypothetical protein
LLAAHSVGAAGAIGFTRVVLVESAIVSSARAIDPHAVPMTMVADIMKKRRMKRRFATLCTNGVLTKRD